MAEYRTYKGGKKNMYSFVLETEYKMLPSVPRCTLKDNINCMSQKYDTWMWVRLAQCSVYCLST